MSRSLLLIPLLVATVASCGKSASSQDKDTAPTSAQGTPEKVQFPGDKAPMSKGVVGGAPDHRGELATGGAPGGAVGGVGGPSSLHSDEGTMTIDKAAGKAGSQLVSNVAITPSSDFHVNVEFPTKITLEPPDGVTVMKTELTAGGAAKAQGDASTFSEKSMVFPIKATAAKPGTYEIKATFKFAVCKVDQCFPKKQAITIPVDAN